MAYGGALVAVGNFRVNTHFSAVLCRDGKVGEMCLGNGEEGHVAKNTAWRPIVVVVEVAAREVCYHSHGELLCRLFPIYAVGYVEHGGVVCRAPFSCLLAIYPKVVAIENSIEANHDAHSAPLIRNVKRSAVVAGECSRTVIFRLAETVRFPATRDRNLTPSTVFRWYSGIFADTFHYL